MYITRVFLLFVGFSVRIFSIIKLLFSLKLFFVNSKRTASTLPLSFQHQELHTIKSSITNLSKMRSGMKHFIERFFFFLTVKWTSVDIASIFIHQIYNLNLHNERRTLFIVFTNDILIREKKKLISCMVFWILLCLSPTRTYFNSPEKKWK